MKPPSTTTLSEPRNRCIDSRRGRSERQPPVASTGTSMNGSAHAPRSTVTCIGG